MNERIRSIIAPGRVAVVTGAAKGIGAAIASELAAYGMRLALFDRDEPALLQMTAGLHGDVLTIVGDVTDPDDLARLHDETIARFGAAHLLVNNAGVIAKAGPWDSPEDWRQTFDTNFTATLRAQNLFVPGMIANPEPAAIVNLGSKEGITTPPGNAAYSVAKAGIKVLTEQLEHELRTTTDGRVSAHLLVPGYTWTPMNGMGTGDRPLSTWSAHQLVSYFIPRLMNGDFYIICPDNDVTPQIDAKRIRWATEDMIENRPALSRWHPDWKDKFTSWLTS